MQRSAFNYKLHVELSHANSEPHPNNGGDAYGLPTSQQPSLKLNVNSIYKITPSLGKPLLNEGGNGEHFLVLFITLGHSDSFTIPYLRKRC